MQQVVCKKKAVSLSSHATCYMLHTTDFAIEGEINE